MQNAAKKSETEFREKIKLIESSTIIYIDEAGIDNRIFRPYARAPRGKKIYADIPGKKRERYSMIGGLMNNKFLAPITFSGGYNTEVLNIAKAS